MTKNCNLLSFQVISVMESTDNFKTFIAALAKGEANTRAIEFIGIIVRNWCRKNKLEIQWIAFENMVWNDVEFYKNIHSAIMKIIRRENIKTYSNYKALILNTAEEMLKKGFENFNTLLIEKNNLAWKCVEEQLKVYAFKWHSSRNYGKDSDCHDLHWSAIHILFEKLSFKKLYFRSSFELKSYYFRILENKMKEHLREKKKENRMSREIPELFYDTDDSKEDDLICFVKKEINKLAENEKYIIQEYFIYEKKLTEIAEELNISAENCRVIKHRALKKLMESIPEREKLYALS